MNVFGPYYFVDPKDGKTVSVTVYVDPREIAQQLAQKALTNANETARTCSGAVLVKVHKK